MNLSVNVYAGISALGTPNRFPKIGFLLFIAAVLAYRAHAQTPSLQQFFQTLVDHYDPSSPPQYENLRRATGQIEGLRPEEITTALPAIFAALAYQDDTVKGYAESALYGIALRPDSAALLKSHADVIGHDLLTVTATKPETRAGEIIILGMLRPPPPEVVRIFLTFLKRTDPDAQAQGSGVIFELMHIAPENPEVIAAVRDFLSRPLDNKSKGETLVAVGNSRMKDGQIIAMMIASLDDPDESVRTTAIQVLPRVGQQALQQAEPALQRLADDTNQPADVRAAAKDALQRLHSHNDNK